MFDLMLFFIMCIGILMTNRAVRLLSDQMQKEYGNNHIITYRLNQDVLENFFGDIRSKGEISNA